MARVNFPSNPTNGASTTVNGVNYIYDSSKGVWKAENNAATTSGKSTLTTYTTLASLPAPGASAGTVAYVTENSRLYISNGAGWYSVSVVNLSPSISSVTDSDGNTTPFTLAIDGSSTVITVTASDSDMSDSDITYSYSVTSGSLTNNGGTTATVSQSGNVFTITPTDSQDYAGEFTLTFSATDGISTGTSANVFSLSFITTIENSKYTSALITTSGNTGSNTSIVDASPNAANITVAGNAHSTTFSPYRSGGYSTYFDGSGDYFTFTGPVLGTGDFTIEFWAKIDSPSDTSDTVICSGGGSSAGTWQLRFVSGALQWTSAAAASNLTGATEDVSAVWVHYAAVRQNGTITFYENGTSFDTVSDSSNYNNTNYKVGINRLDSNYYSGFIRDLRVSSSAIYTSSFTAPNEPLSAESTTEVLVCHLPYIADGSSNSAAITVYGNTSTKPFGPYDYNEYAVADHGGSISFDGSGDTVNLPGADFSADFTMEGWAYWTGTGNRLLATNRTDVYTTGAGMWWIDEYSGNIRFYFDTGSRVDISGAWPKNQWVHWAVSRSSGALKIFLNGVERGSSTNSNNLGATNTPIYFGGFNGTTNYSWQGYQSDIRVTSGTGLYTTDFTPPTSPLSSTSSAIHVGKGTDVNIIDKAQSRHWLDWSGGTSPQASSGQTKYKSSSIYFLNKPLSHYQEPMTGDFTIEGWVYLSTASGVQTISANSFGSAYGHLIWVQSSKLNFRFYTSGGAQNNNEAGTATISAGTWYHIAIVRSGSTITSYVDGVADQTATHTDKVGTVNEWYVGTYSDGGAGPWVGYMDDVRFTNGLARYTSGFTPPTTSLTI